MLDSSRTLPMRRSAADSMPPAASHPAVVAPEEQPRSGSRTRALALLFAALVGLLVFLFHLPFDNNTYLVDDSADYLRASTADFGATYLNTNSASPLALRRMLKDPAFKAAPWDLLYFRDDNAAIRHFHSPVAFYAMHAVGSLHGDNRDQRLLVSAVTAVTCGVMTAGLILLGAPLAVAAPLALLAGLQTSYIEVSADPTPHSWYMLFAMVFLVLFARYLLTRRFRTLALAAIALGIAFSTLEFSLELVLSIPVAIGTLWILRRWPIPVASALLKQMLRAVPIFLATTFLAWPGGWLHGGFFETYGVTGATLVFKNKNAFGAKLSAGLIYGKLFEHHAGVLAVFVFFWVSLIYLLLKRKLSVESAVFSSYAFIAFGLGLGDHFRLNTYVAEFLVFLLAASGFLCRDVLRSAGTQRSRLYSGAICVLLLLAGAQEWAHRRTGLFFRPWLQPVMATIAAEVPKGQTILVNKNWESFYEYLPGYDYEPTVDPDSNVPRTPARAAGARFFLFSNTTPPPTDATLLHSYPTYAPGHELDLYEAR